MFYAYVIQSEKDGSFYKGHCEDLETRIHQHNSGQTQAIKSRLPFRLVYHEVFLSRDQAIREREHLDRSFSLGAASIRTLFSSFSFSLSFSVYCRGPIAWVLLISTAIHIHKLPKQKCHYALPNFNSDQMQICIEFHLYRYVLLI